MLALFLPGPWNMCKTCAIAFVETPCWSFRAWGFLSENLFSEVEFYCIGTQYLFQLPLSFFFILVKAQGCLVARCLGSSRNWRMDNKQVCHICNKHRPYWSWTLGPYCKKGLLCSKSPMCTLSQNGYGANLFPPKVHIRPLKSHQEKCRAHTECYQRSLPHSLPSMLLQATDTHSSSFSPLHNTRTMLGPHQKKRQSWAHSCYQRSLTPIQAHSLPSACRAESCLLCCQPEPSLSHYLPDYHRLLHDSLADCKLKGDELSTWVSGHSNNSCTSLPCPDVTGRCIPSTSLYSSWLEGLLAFILLCLVAQPLCPQVSSSTPFANLPG